MEPFPLTCINLSRELAESVPFDVGHRDWLISISDTDSRDANVTAPFGRILFMKFDDIDDDDSQAVKYGWVPFSDGQAAKLAYFTQWAMKEEKNLYVNCHAGVSRSGAVVEALKLVGFRYVENEYSPYMIPNATVLKKLRIALGLVQGWEVL